MRRMVAAAAVLVLSAACADPAGPATDGPTEPTAASAPPTVPPTRATAPQATVPATTLAPASDWEVVVIGSGIKPVLALDPGGRPAIAWLREDLAHGVVAYAAAAEGWAVDEFVDGYFYGPIGLAFDPVGQPHVVWHDHQADTFQPDLGDLTHAVRTGGEWEIVAAADDGHDGWDSTVAIGADGVVRAAGVDPLQFDREDGVEYYELGDAGWTVEAIGSGPTEYEWNVSLALDAGGEPALTWFDQSTRDLRFAQRVEGIWSIETVAETGDAGRFSSLAFDGSGRPHVSFVRMVDGPTADVVYATRGESGWEEERVSTLSSLELGFTGARRSTSLALTAEGAPVVAFADTEAVWLATRSAGGAWRAETVLARSGAPLGQLVSLAVDAAGLPHVATHVSDGQVVYATPATS